MCVAFVTWKLVRLWHVELAEKTGRTIDASICAAAEKLEKTAIALENAADRSPGETLGKGLDEVLMDAKKTLEMATDLVLNVLKHKK
jgi:phosphoribosyl-dephospho-CoA transferase